MICDDSLAEVQSTKINILKQTEHMGKQDIFDTGVDIVEEGLDIYYALGQHNSASRGVIDAIKNSDDVGSIINNVVSNLSI